MQSEAVTVEYIVIGLQRLVRALGYAVLGFILSHINQFGTPFSWYIPVALAILGVSSASERIAQFGIAVLLFMALVPLEALKGAI